MLLDFHLPDLSGDKILEKIRSESQISNTYVVVITADATTATRDKMKSLGANEYLTKPLDILQLKHIVKNQRHNFNRHRVN